jgi:MFS family permease
MAVDQQKSAELVARLERLPFSRWHRNFFVLAFFGIMFDAMDFALFGAALPPISREFGLGPAQSGLLATVGLIGAFLGALFWGTFSDYIGRRTAFQATVGIFALFTGLMAATWNVGSLIVFRFLSNFGLGGEVPVTTTLASEFSPGRIRGALTGNILAAFPVGLIVAALVSLLIIPTLGWRALFIVGVVPAVLLFFARWYMPESVRYLLSKGRVAEAERRGESAWSNTERGGDSHRPKAGSCRSERRHSFRAVRTGASADDSSCVDRLVRFPVGLQWHSLHAADHPDRARHPAHPSDQLPARSGNRRVLWLFNLQLPH